MVFFVKSGAEAPSAVFAMLVIMAYVEIIGTSEDQSLAVFGCGELLALLEARAAHW